MREMLRETLLRPRPREDALADAIRELCGRMRAVDAHFEEETDGDLLDSYIYERLALQARYRYLTRQVKRREERRASRRVVSAPAPAGAHVRIEEASCA